MKFCSLWSNGVASKHCEVHKCTSLKRKDMSFLKEKWLVKKFSDVKETNFKIANEFAVCSRKNGFINEKPPYFAKWNLGSNEV